MNLYASVARAVRDDRGQDIIEYSLLGMFISVVAYLTLQSIGQDVSTLYSDVSGPVSTAGATIP